MVKLTESEESAMECMLLEADLWAEGETPETRRV